MEPLDIKQRFEKLFQQGTTPWTEHEIDDSIPAFAEHVLRRNPNPYILDIGCGNGWLSIYFAKRGLRVEGIDSSPTAIAEAVTEAEQKGVADKVHFRLGDGLELPYAVASFDAVFDRGFFHHMPEERYEDYFAGVTSVLVPQGLLSVHAFSTRNREGIGHRFEKEDIERIFGEHFKLLEHNFDPWPTSAPAHLGHYLLEKK